MPLRNNVTNSDNLKGLSENDVALLREMATAYRNTIYNPRLRPVIPANDKQTPETYIVLTPDSGIPALSETDDLLTGTGTGTGEIDDNPGSATCRIFQRFGLTNELQDIGFTEVVYNVTKTAITGNIFVLATRSKEGDLQVVAGGGGGGNVSITYGGAGCPALSDANIQATSHTTCDIYRLGNAPPAAPDVAKVHCQFLGDYQCGLAAGQLMSSGYRFHYIMLVPLNTDIRDAYDSGLTAGADTVYVPHGIEEVDTGTGTGTGEEDDNYASYNVVFVERTAWGTANDMKRVYLSRHVTNWPSTNI